MSACSDTSQRIPMVIIPEHFHKNHPRSLSWTGRIFSFRRIIYYLLEVQKIFGVQSAAVSFLGRAHGFCLTVICDIPSARSGREAFRRIRTFVRLWEKGVNLPILLKHNSLISSFEFVLIVHYKWESLYVCFHVLFLLCTRHEGKTVGQSVSFLFKFYPASIRRLNRNKI